MARHDARQSAQGEDGDALRIRGGRCVRCGVLLDRTIPFVDWQDQPTPGWVCATCLVNARQRKTRRGTAS